MPSTSVRPELMERMEKARRVNIPETREMMPSSS